MGDSLAVAAAVAGANAASRGLGAKPSVGAKLGDWFGTQQDAGKDLVAKIDFQDATVIAVIGAVMSYKEKKMVALITQAVGSFIKLYLLMLFVRVLLTWFPNVDWMRQPWAVLRHRPVPQPLPRFIASMCVSLLSSLLPGVVVLQCLAKVAPRIRRGQALLERAAPQTPSAIFVALGRRVGRLVDRRA